MTRRKGDVAVVVAIAAIAHCVYFSLRFGSFYFPDSFTYLEPAKQLLAGHGFVNRIEVETLRTPGYPLLLVLFGARTVPVIVLQHLASCVLVAAIFLFTVRRTGSRLAAYVASLLFALDVPSIAIANKLLTETVFTCILFVIFALSFRERPPSVLIALLTGLLVLVRPIAILFFAIVVWKAAASRRTPRIVFVVVALALPMAWAARNWAHTRVFTVSSIGDINLLGQRAAGALAIEDGGDFRADLADEGRGLTEDADDSIQQKLNIPDAEELPTAVRAKYYGAYAKKIIAQHPVAFVELTIRGLLVNAFESDWEAMEPVTLLHPSLLQYSLGVVPAVVFVFAVIGIAAMWRRDRSLALMITATAGYFIFMSAGGEAEARFRIPVVPEIAIAAGAGAAAVRRAIRTSCD